MEMAVKQSLLEEVTFDTLRNVAEVTDPEYALPELVIASS
jgi:hypothetical protein